MITRNRTGAWALTVALLLSPLMPLSVPEILAATQQEQQSDVPTDAEQAMFSRGQTLYNQGRYDQAATVLKDFLKNYPNSIITDLTLLWLGRSYMQLGKFQDAEAIGQRLRTIKDTPFAEIYEGEMQAARRESSARRTTTAPTTAPPSTETKPGTTPPVAAQPKQTPPPVVSPTPYMVTGPSAATAQSNRRSTGTPGATLNTPSQNVTQNNSSPEIAQNPRGRRRGRGRQVPPTQQQALANTGQPRTVTSPVNSNANANTQGALNTTTRTAATPVPQPSARQPSTATET
ncbi:MAG TPA: tetratricopeptide repeat protein, partial [Pyrinomonadaceae bacterium]